VYPNPFKDELNIEYSLSVGTNVKIDLYNVLGQVIQVLFSDFREPGKHHLTIGSMAGMTERGMYYLKVTTGDETSVIRLIR
jgi:hypothetical protein